MSRGKTVYLNAVYIDTKSALGRMYKDVYGDSSVLNIYTDLRLKYIHTDLRRYNLKHITGFETV